jgi:small subunit ribosomal protein S1
VEILTAEFAGFCSGVERAFSIAVDSVKKGRTVYMLGNLVHNRQVVEKLAAFGIKNIKHLSEISDRGGILLISAHGVGPEVYAEVNQLGIEIFDTTCPWVKKAQRIAQDLTDEGRLVLMVGDKGHPEVEGILGWSGNKALVVEKLEDLEKISLPKDARVGILAQTTQSAEKFDQLVSAVRKMVDDVKEYDTICGATTRRQSAAIALAKKVELMIVIGDPLSANTRRLTELCRETGTNTCQIEEYRDLKPEWLIGKQKVGVTAGASTPSWIIEDVINHLKHFAKI